MIDKNKNETYSIQVETNSHVLDIPGVGCLVPKQNLIIIMKRQTKLNEREHWTQPRRTTIWRKLNEIESSLRRSNARLLCSCGCICSLDARSHRALFEPYEWQLDCAERSSSFQDIRTHFLFSARISYVHLGMLGVLFDAVRCTAMCECAFADDVLSYSWTRTATPYFLSRTAWKAPTLFISIVCFLLCEERKTHTRLAVASIHISPPVLVNASVESGCEPRTLNFLSYTSTFYYYFGVGTWICFFDWTKEELSDSCSVQAINWLTVEIRVRRTNNWN